MWAAAALELRYDIVCCVAHLELKEHQIDALTLRDKRVRGRIYVRRSAIRARLSRVPHVCNDRRESALTLRQRLRARAR